MKQLILLAALLLCASSSFAATGTINSARVCGSDAAADGRINGYVLEVNISGLTTGGTYSLVDSSYPSTPPYNPASAATVTLTVTSVQPIVGGGTTTVTRTLYGTKWLRQPYPTDTTADEIAAGGTDCGGNTVAASTVTVRIVISDGVYAGDTGITLTASGGFYTQGGNPNLSVSGLSVTNSASASINACSNLNAYPANCSAAVYPQPMCRFATTPYQDVQTATFLVEVACFHRHFAKFQPIQAVVISAADAHSHTVSYTVSTLTKSAYCSGCISGDAGVVQIYAASIVLSTLTQGDTVTVNFKAYPWVGDANSVLDSSATVGTVVTSAKNAGGAGYAANDTGTVTGSTCTVNPMYKVLTVTATVVTTYSLTYGGYQCTQTTAAATTAGGPQPGAGTGFTVNTTVLRGVAGNEDIGPLVFLNDKNATYGNPCAIVDPASTGASKQVYATCALAETAYAGNHNTAYVTTGLEKVAVQTYNNANNGHNDPGGGFAELVNASHTLDCQGASATQATWFNVQPMTGVTQAQALIVAGSNCALNVRLAHFRGVTINDSGCSGGTCYILVGNIGGPGTATNDRLWLDQNEITHPGGAIYGWTGYATNNVVNSINVTAFGTFSTRYQPWPLIRGNTMPAAGANCSLYAILGNSGCTAQSMEQSNVATEALSDGAIYAFNSFESITSGNLNSGGGFYWNANGSTMNYGQAWITNVLEAKSSAGGPVLDICDLNCTSSTRNILMWDNSIIGERFNGFYNSGGDAGDGSGANWWMQTQISIVGNLFAAFNVKGDVYGTPVANGARTGNWWLHYHVGSGSNWFMNANNGGNEGPNTWLGEFAGMNSNYNGAQVTGTDSNPYVAKAISTGASGNKPITGGSYATFWTNTGATGGDGNQTWTTGNIYNVPGFTTDKSYSTGTGAGGGTYTIAGSTAAASGANGLRTLSYCPLPYDFAGNARNCSGGSAGAYEGVPPLTLKGTAFLIR